MTRPARARGTAPSTLTGVIGGMLVGFDEQVMRSRPRVEELVKAGTEYRAVAADGSTVVIGPPLRIEEPTGPTTGSAVDSD